MEWIFIGLALAAWGWYSGMLAKEAALRAARRACKQYDRQLLDETVALEGMSLRRDRSGRVRVLRRYGFDYTDDGDQRCHGQLTLLGERLLATSMDEEGTVQYEHDAANKDH